MLGSPHLWPGAGSAAAGLTVAIAHQQHSVVDEPGATEGPQRVGDPTAVELWGWGQKEAERQSPRVGRGRVSGRRRQQEALTCMPNALMATEIGPLLANQAASPGWDGGGQVSVGSLSTAPPLAPTHTSPPRALAGTHPVPCSLCSFRLSSTESLM